MFKVGGFLKDLGDVDYSVFSRQVSRAYEISKWITSVSVSMVPWLVLLFVGFETSSTHPDIYAALTSLITIFLTIFLEIQNMVGLFMLRIPETLGPLPLDSKKVRSIIILLYFKLYDRVIVSFLASTAIAVMVLTRNPWIVVIQFIISLLTISYGLGLALLVSKVFYILLGRIEDTSARYIASSIYALSIALVVSLPFYAEIMTEQVATWFLTLTFENDLLLSIIFPFNFYLSFGRGLSRALSLGSSIGYVLLGLFSWAIIYKELTKLSASSRLARVDQWDKPQTLILKFSKQSLTKVLLNKYIKTVFRFPGYSIVFFLPLTLALISFLSYPSDPVLGIQTISLGMMIFPPIILSVEAFGHEYTRTLPLSLKTVFKTLSLLGTLEYTFTYFFYILLISSRFPGKGLEVLNTVFTLLHIPGLIMIELWLLFKLEGERVFTGSFYMKLSRTILVYIATYTLFFIPVWSSYYFALIFLNKILLFVIPLAISTLFFIIGVILFSRIGQSSG